MRQAVQGRLFLVVAVIAIAAPMAATAPTASLPAKAPGPPAAAASSTMSTSARFACSATAAITATCCVHPLDVIRVRLQVDTGKAVASAIAKPAATMISTAGLIWRTGGVAGMYAGIQAGIARQLSYGMPRMAFFTMGMERLSNGGQLPVDFGTKMMLGSLAGGVAASIGVPTEVSLVRMAADARITDPAMRRNYKGIVDAVSRRLSMRND